jgi:hypothetical protein
MSTVLKFIYLTVFNTSKRLQLFLLSKTLKRWHATPDEWIKKIWYPYTIEHYSTIKKNEIMSFAGKWMELEVIMLSKIRQVERQR